MESKTSTFLNFFFTSTVLFFLSLLCLLIVGCASNRVTQEQISRDFPTTENAVNINEANSAELETLPFVGAKTAKEIVRHRKKHGKFRRPEHLILVRGISDRRFRKMRSMVRVE